MRSQMRRLLESYRPLQKYKGSFLIEWSESNQTRQHLDSQNIVIDDDKVKDGKAECLGILGRQSSIKSPLTLKAMERIVFTEPNYFLSHYYCLFHPIYCAIMPKTLTPLNVSKVASAKLSSEGCF